MSSGKKPSISEIQLDKIENHHPNSNKTEHFPPLKDWALGRVLMYMPKGNDNTCCLGVSMRGQRLGSDTGARWKLGKGEGYVFFPLDPYFREFTCLFLFLYRYLLFLIKQFFLSLPGSIHNLWHIQAELTVLC